MNIMCSQIRNMNCPPLEYSLTNIALSKMQWFSLFESQGSKTAAGDKFQHLRSRVEQPDIDCIHS